MSVYSALNKYRSVTLATPKSKAEYMLNIVDHLISFVIKAQEARKANNYVDSYNAISKCTKTISALDQLVDQSMDDDATSGLRAVYSTLQLRLNRFVVDNSPAEEYSSVINILREYRELWEDAKKLENDAGNANFTSGAIESKQDRDDSETSYVQIVT